ncbi:MAG TPA: universal stress protein [Gammaproteobacteria bacterium]|nr:universal stress protein [Gammaproteobacteria bacterium]
MHKHVLIPVDGSDHSFKALDVAADLARTYGSKLTILHVVPSNEVPEGLQRWAKTEQFLDPPQAIYEQAIADRILEAAESRLKGKDIRSIQRASERGDAAKKILEVAKRKGADLIVLGTRGLSDFQGLVLGSVAHKVTHAAPCTVVTVR